MKKSIRDIPLDAKAIRQLRQLRLEGLLFSGGGLGTSLPVLRPADLPKLPASQGE